MPIKVPSDLPALRTLERENIFVMHTRRAESQDIRPLRVLLLNLMPTKLETDAAAALSLEHSAPDRARPSPDEKLYLDPHPAGAPSLVLHEL